MKHPYYRTGTELGRAMDTKFLGKVSPRESYDYLSKGGRSQHLVKAVDAVVAALLAANKAECIDGILCSAAKAVETRDERWVPGVRALAEACVAHNVTGQVRERIQMMKGMARDEMEAVFSLYRSESSPAAKEEGALTGQHPIGFLPYGPTQGRGPHATNPPPNP